MINSILALIRVLVKTTRLRAPKTLVLLLFASTIAGPCYSQEIELLLGGKVVKAKVLRNAAAIPFDKEVIDQLHEKGVREYHTIESPGEPDLAIFKMDGGQKRRFDKVIKDHNLNSDPEDNVRSSYVLEYGNTENILKNEFSVAFVESATQPEIDAFLQKNGLEVIGRNAFFKNQFNVRFINKHAIDALLALPKDSIVRYFEPNFIQIQKRKPSGTNNPRAFIPDRSILPPMPNDPLLNLQWHLIKVNADGQLAPIPSTIDSWNVTTGNGSITIAILDDGVDVNHPDLKDKIVNAYNAFDTLEEQSPNRYEPHGTACAGIAAASTNNGIGVAGIAWNCKIMPVKIFGLNESNEPITSADAVQRGIMKAVQAGAKILNCSWGGGLPAGKVNDAIDYAVKNSCIMVFAAGNNGIEGLEYPANLAKDLDVISVNSVNESDDLKVTNSDGEGWGSNWGDGLTLTAPGIHICTTDLTRPGRGYSSDSEYFHNFNGTSSSAPLVSGAIGLLLSIDPSLTPAQVKELLSISCDDLGERGYDPKFGHGRLNTFKLMSNAKLARPSEIK
ncbi:MAG TPA: S8 family serine peptidase [Cyclobacteriaceae bacterium]|nr:S8 family serine peptidase [Cyclobacteriaceae bacterium]